jgi:hypothetical protein
MNAIQSQRHLHFSELPLSTRVLHTAVLLILGLAYLFGSIYLYHTYAGRAGGNPMLLTYQDIVVAYSGSGSSSRLEAALRGPMRAMLPAEEATPIFAWVSAGAERAAYEAQIRPTLEKRCMSCHDGSNPHLADFSSYEKLRKVTERDTGTGIFTLVRVSHIHLFGLTMMFYILGTIFSHAQLRPAWFKAAVIATPFASLVLDIGSWYFTKLYQPFAWVVIGGGAMMALAFAFMWAVSLYQLWLWRAPAGEAQGAGMQGRLVG